VRVATTAIRQGVDKLCDHGRSTTDAVFPDEIGSRYPFWLNQVIGSV
jgi:hypothetical protein